jgi:hypothetical protein
MALKKRGKYSYGDSQPDIRAEVLRYGKKGPSIRRYRR